MAEQQKTSLNGSYRFCRGCIRDQRHPGSSSDLRLEHASNCCPKGPKDMIVGDYGLGFRVQALGLRVIVSISSVWKCILI